jgi:predicted amidophosphoribosyltransferase
VPTALNIAVPTPIKRAASAVRGVFRIALDLALPQLCPACRDSVEGRGLCASCWSKLSFITRPYCERLGIPFVYDPGPGILSMEAIADPPSYYRARAAVRFDEISRALVHALKYGDRLDLAPMMGRWIAHAGQELLAEADALVPVPLHWRRLWARRFNQSAMLAATVSAESGVPSAAGALVCRRVGNRFHRQDARPRIVRERNAEPLAIGAGDEGQLRPAGRTKPAPLDWRAAGRAERRQSEIERGSQHGPRRGGGSLDAFRKFNARRHRHAATLARARALVIGRRRRSFASNVRECAHGRRTARASSGDFRPRARSLAAPARAGVAAGDLFARSGG